MRYDSGCSSKSSHDGSDTTLARDAAPAQEAARGQRDVHLGAGADQDDVGIRIALEHVPATGRIGHRIALRIEHRERLAGQDERRRQVAPQRDPPARDRLVRIGGTEDAHVGRRPQGGELLDRLVGRAVLAEPDRVVGVHPDDGQPRERREAHRRLRVVEEVEERRDVRPQAGGGEAVRDGAHAVLADAEAQVATGVGTGLEVLPPFRAGVVGRREVGRTADHLRDLRDDLGDDLARGGPRGHGLLVAAEGLDHELGDRRVRKRADGRLPFRLLRRADVERLPVALQNGVRNEEELVRVEAQRPLRLGLLLGAAGVGVGSGRPGVDGAVADDRLHRDERRLPLVGDALGDGGVDRIEIVPVLDRERVPAEGRVARHPVLGEGELRVAVDRDVVVVVEEDEIVELEVPGE